MLYDDDPTSCPSNSPGISLTKLSWHCGEAKGSAEVSRVRLTIQIKSQEARYNRTFVKLKKKSICSYRSN